MIVIGSAALQREDGGALHAQVVKLAQSLRAASGAPTDWKVLNVLHGVCGPSLFDFLQLVCSLFIVFCY